MSFYGIFCITFSFSITSAVNIPMKGKPRFKIFEFVGFFHRVFCHYMLYIYMNYWKIWKYILPELSSLQFSWKLWLTISTVNQVCVCIYVCVCVCVCVCKTENNTNSNTMKGTKITNFSPCTNKRNLVRNSQNMPTYFHLNINYLSN